MSFGWVEASKGAIDTNRSGLHELFRPGELETARVVRLATTFGFRRSGVADLSWRCTDLGLDRAGIGEARANTGEVNESVGAVRVMER